MKARLIAFGEIEVEEERYDYDVVIDGGKVRKRKKGPSKQYREGNGHTPLSLKEEIPWSGRQLIVGTGTYGRLPIMAEVQQEAERRGVNSSPCRRKRHVACCGISNPRTRTRFFTQRVRRAISEFHSAFALLSRRRGKLRFGIWVFVEELCEIPLPTLAKRFVTISLQ